MVYDEADYFVLNFSPSVPFVPFVFIEGNFRVFSFWNETVFSMKTASS